MNYSDEIPLCRFGTPLEPLEEDDVPKKKIAIEDQIVTDENGRRRFHGAFTGGFSAGFWNTVGSLEGWKPKSFKSSRTEKAEKQRSQLPKDFMDDEDLGEFGIAPQRVQAKEDFAKNDSNNRKRIASHINKPADTLGPVLQEMLESPREKVAVRLLMHMGWKPGQGVGARQTMKEKTLANKRNRELYVLKMYGCEMETNKKGAITNSEESADSAEDEEDFEITFAPDDFEPFVCNSKDNVFGLGYSGLGGQISAKMNSHINLFGPLEVLGKDNKKLSIRGQAFGVGALEEEDEDIYAKDDMSQYDFCLNEKKKVDKKKILKQDQCVIEGFAADSQTKQAKTVFTIPLDANFQPKNWLQRKTRFDKLPETEMLRIMHNDAHKKKGIARHDIGPDERGNILCSQTVKGNNERTNHMEQINKTSKSLEAKDFVSSSKLKELKVTNQEVKFSALNDTLNAEKEKVTDDLTKAMSSKGETFKPFAPNAEKQERYEKFIAANLKNEEDIQRFLKTIQPIHLSEWDREMERKEFIQARSIYKPLNGLMSERFVSKTFLNDSMDLPATKIDNPCGKKIINVQRTKIAWKPCSLIYKRFNIPETFSGAITESKPTKKGKFSIFDYIENSVNTKKDFITPVIIPKHIEKPLEVQRHTAVDSNKKVILEQVVTIPNIETLNSESASNTVQKSARKSKSPKTELELKIEACKHKHPSEKKDLFKSIFDSSSESDSESNVQNDSKPKAGTEISSEIVDKLIKPSTSRNILKNNSPPRGIFASLFSSAPSKVEAQPISNPENQNVKKILFKPVHQRESTNLLESEDMYGPKLPQNISVIGSKTSKEKDIDRKIMELLSTKSSEKKIIEKWVEKKHSSKNKKKHKRKDLDTTETKHRKLKKKKKSHKKD